MTKIRIKGFYSPLYGKHMWLVGTQFYFDSAAAIEYGRKLYEERKRIIELCEEE